MNKAIVIAECSIKRNLIQNLFDYYLKKLQQSVSSNKISLFHLY